tara:strand:- start:664 stop:2412 length:1749 start_codon:yes stop_codon:yes gene_type:complete
VAGKTKLELTWIGKHNRPRLEPRILLEDTEKSYHAEKHTNEDGIFDNKLVFGDNLLALKALEAEYAGQVKCIYIDPPFNIDAANVPYEDNIEQSLWLSLMRSRLEILRRLLKEDGVIFVHIDDEMFPYLAIVMDEIFGKKNRLNVIAVKMSEASGVKMSHVDKRLPKLKEYILAYKKDVAPIIDVEKIPAAAWNNEYKTLLEGISRDDIGILKEIISKEICNQNDVDECISILKNATTITLNKYFKERNIKEKEQNSWKFENAWRIIQAVGSSSVFNLAKRQPGYSQEISAALSATGLIYLYKTDFDTSAKQPRVQVIFADDNLMQNPGDFWTDIKTTGGVGQEGGVLFPNSKKPEALLKRIIGMSTKPRDIVLDSFAGSGTTGAVAHKMGRRWVMVELGEHCHTHIAPRMQNVINGTDQTGVSKAVNWMGGGGYRYFRLASSLLEKDKWGQYVISKDYKPEMLAEAVCKLMGFTYAPSQDRFWQHGHSTENDFIYVTTQRLTHDALRKLSHEVGDGRTLLVCCRAHDENTFDNLTVRKIPHAVMAKCEWGRDDYSLNIQEASAEPITESDLDEDDTVEAAE